MKGLKNKHCNYYNIDKREDYNKKEDYKKKSRPSNVDTQIIYKILLNNNPSEKYLPILIKHYLNVNGALQ